MIFDLEADPKYKQIKLLEAKIKKRIKVGDILEESINPKNFLSGGSKPEKCFKSKFKSD